MQTNIDELIHVRMDGELAELLAKIDPGLYEKYMVPEGKKRAIYLRLTKALYGTLQAALLFWKDLSGALVEWGFELNKYDRCVANKTIDGKQCTILWHVDDLKISHVDDAVVTKILETLNERYGKITPLVVTRGKIHDYLGMTLDFSANECCVVRMDDYVESVLDEAPVDMDGEAETPAAEHLFTVRDDATKVTKEVGELYHSLTARLLFLSKRARPEIQTAVAFLCTRTQSTDTDDYNKLARVVRYLRRYPKLALTLEADDVWVVKWSIDASFAVHVDMRSHTGGCGSLGKGMFSTTSSKQKMNTRSSTEAELVGVDDMMAKVLWTQYFLKAQGYDVGPAVVAQDNKSSILLETNGMKSSTKRTRHINVRYYFVTDRINKGDMVVEYCPTADMISDILTKPLQGSPFRKLRALLLNLKDDPTKNAVVLAHRSVLEYKTARSRGKATSSRGYNKTWHDDVTVHASGSRRNTSNAVKCR
jgi:Reverse transcriptase (RNA-dependent DNA polymerase)